MLNILKKQNESEILKLLYSARKNYNLAESNFIWLSLFTLFPIVIQLMNFENNLKPVLILISYIMFSVFSLAFHQRIKIGSETKEFIDRSLFGLGLDFDKTQIDRIKAEASRLAIKYKNEYNEQINNTGENDIKGVKDWYYININDADEVENIYQCQCQNIYWDKELNKILKYIYSIIFMLLLLSLAFAFKTKSSLDFLSLLVVMFPILSATFYFFIECIKFNGISTSLETTLNMFNKLKCNDDKKVIIEEIQKSIFKRRRSKMIVPNVLHRFKSNILHKLWKDSII